MPICSSVPRAIQAYACLATQEGDDKTDPSNEHFNPEFTFTPLTAAAFTAAGQRCVVPAHETVDCTAGNGWSPLDTGAYMFLQFEELSSSAEVTVSDSTRPGHEECRLGGTGSKCELTTYPGSSNSLEVANRGEAKAEVVVLAEAEEPKDLATEEKAGLIGLIAEALAEALKAFDEGEGDEAVLGSPPQLSGLRATPGATASTAQAARPGGGLTISYRDDSRATTVFTISRALPGGGWSRLGGLHVRAASDSYSALRHRAGKACPRGATRTGQGACHLKLELRGHLRHRDHVGRNELSFRGIGGKQLAPGRYRLTAVALLHARRSRPVTSTFTVGGRATNLSKRLTELRVRIRRLARVTS